MKKPTIKTKKGRRTFSVHERLRIDNMVDGEPYVHSVVGGGKSYAISLSDGITEFEERMIASLGLKKGDKVDFFLHCKKVEA